MEKEAVIVGAIFAVLLGLFVLWARSERKSVEASKAFLHEFHELYGIQPSGVLGRTINPKGEFCCVFRDYDHNIRFVLDNQLLRQSFPTIERFSLQVDDHELDPAPCRLPESLFGAFSSFRLNCHMSDQVVSIDIGTIVLNQTHLQTELFIEPLVKEFPSCFADYSSLSQAELEDLLTNYGLPQVTKELKIGNSKGKRKTIIALDEGSCQMVVVSSNGNKRLHFRDVIEVELVKQGKTITKTSASSLVKRGIVGGILLGGVGVIAGASTSKKHAEESLDELHIKMIVRNGSEPLYYIVFDLKGYESEAEAMNDAEKVFAELKILVLNSQQNKTEPELPDTPTALADQIQQLFELKKAGALSNSEFEAAKARLLLP